jgi:flagellar biosynthesis protein FlhF
VKLKTYQAYSMAQALDAVRRDLGADAVILHTRSFKRWRLPALWRWTIVEVTATPGRDLAPRKFEEPFKPVNPRTSAARRAYAATAPGTGNHTDRSTHDYEQDRLRTRRLAQAMLARIEQERTEVNQSAKAKQPSPAPSANGSPRAHAVNRALAADAAAPPATPPATSSTARRFRLSESTQAAGPAPGHGVAQTMLVPGTATSTEIASNQRRGSLADSRTMQEELSAIRTMVGQVLQRQAATRDAPGTPGGAGQATPPGAPPMPHQLFEMYLKLIEQDLSEDLADRIVRQVRDEIAPEQLDDFARVRQAVMHHLAELVPVAIEAAPRRGSDGRPLTIALVGPTGVGKTTTLAKLAATFKLRHGCRVGLITCDTYRIAAVEQLRTYANIIGLPLEVVLTPADMQQAAQKLSDVDVILIDTAGRSQNDSDRLDELRQFVDAAQPHEVHLVLSSTASERVLLREAEAFAPVGVHRMVLTKLDEAVSFGMLVNVIRKVDKQLSFVTTGQEVPDHIEAGRAERLAELVLDGAVRA